MCSAPNVYMFVYILIGTHMVPLNSVLQTEAQFKSFKLLASYIVQQDIY